MSPLHSWTLVSSCTSVDGIDTSIESFANSPAQSCCDIIFTNPALAFAPAMARTSDWVDQQSPRDQMSGPKPMADPSQPVTPPPRAIRESSNASTSQHHVGEAIGRRTKKVYDIPSLLSLRHVQGQVPVMLHVKPEAIAENIFQYIGATSTRRVPSRSRGLSDISNASRGSFNSASNPNYNPSGTSKFPYPPRTYRQPLATPIENPSIERVDGFVRFLAQHASPPHHRVTAGGRIVPAGPSSPPPMLDYASLNSLLREQQEGRSILSVLKSQNAHNQGAHAMAYGSYIPNASNNMASQSAFSSHLMQVPAPYSGNPYGYQVVSSTTPTPTTIVPLGMFPDGSTLVSCNGVNYRTYWNGLNTVMEPLQPFQVSTDQQNLAPLNAPYNIPVPPISNPQASMSTPLANATNEMRAPSRKASEASETQPRGNQEADLKAQLTKLDKHLALYHYEISPTERSELVAQRRLLIEALDKIRVAKEHTKRSIPIIEPGLSHPITPVSKLNFDRKVTVRTPSGLHDTDTRTVSNNDSLHGKGLSPAALPFVPRKARNVSSDTSRMRNFSDQTENSSLNVSKRRTAIQAQVNVKDMANLAMARKDKALDTHRLSGSTRVSSYREESTSSVLDPTDPAMRVIDYEDIEYAQRYLYNWNLKSKAYCTTTAEFQEAIRRVREQARCYGCLGGQSKDPAYDAEQDLWWAICERDPIPLPTKVPDHVRNPRPWNWDDSAFNFRRCGATAPVSESSWVNARNSPRLMGWDAITAEKLKDTVDVSRSYYALKGQLPSVAFRTWAYDQHGSKIDLAGENQKPTGSDHRSSADASSGPALIDEAPNTRALQVLDTNEVSNRPVKPSVANRTRLGRKMNLTEGDAVPRAVSSPSQLAMNAEASPNGRRLSPLTSAESRLLSRSRQAYIEDYPESPTKAPLSSASKKALHSPGPNSPLSTLLRENGKGESSTIDRTSMSKHYRNDHPAEKGHIRDSGSQIRSVEIYPLTPAVAPSSQSAQLPQDLFSYPSPEAKQHRGQGLRNPKVNIPITTRSPLRSKLDDSEVKSFNVPSTPTSSAHLFLRNMLKGTNNSTPASKTSAQGSSMMAELFKTVLGSSSEGTRKSTDKENVASVDKVSASSDSKSVNVPQPSASKTIPDCSISKAQSSLASSNYQAHGYLASLDGPGKAHTASLYNYQVHEPLPQIRVNLPPCSSREIPRATSTDSAYNTHGGSGICDIESAYHTGVSFGMDGGTDTQAANEDDEVLEKAKKKHPNFDFKGVTHADYETKREDTNNTWHHGKVEDFFQEIAEKERCEIARVQGNGKGTA